MAQGTAAVGQWGRWSYYSREVSSSNRRSNVRLHCHRRRQGEKGEEGEEDERDERDERARRMRRTRGRFRKAHSF